MFVSHLSLTDFRSYPTLELDLEAGLTVFTGRNGQGKTNLVEAVGYLSTLSSHRVAATAPLVRFGAERAIVRGTIRRGGTTTLVEVQISPGHSTRARINRTPVPRARDILGLLHTVTFAPGDLALVSGDPRTRRDLLDGLVVALSPRYAAVCSDLERVVRQRGMLLKSMRAARGSRRWRGTGDDAATWASTLSVWDDQLIDLGAQLVRARAGLVARLRPLVAESYRQISDSPGLARAVYRSTVPVADRAESVPDLDAVRESFRRRLEEVHQAEVDRAVTLVGPHRDELELFLGPAPAKGYASHGETWSFALALRLASFELLRGAGSDPAGPADHGADPVLILDDVFAELDLPRRERLGRLVADTEQVLVTAAVGDDLPEALTGRRLRVTLGNVTREER